MQWTRQKSDLVLAVYGITLIIGLPANLLAFYTFVGKIKRSAKPIDVLLLSLNISDLICLFFLPLRIKEAADMKWTMSSFFCSVSIFIYFTTIYNSTFLLTAISVERYLGVAFPIKYKLKRHPRNAVIASVMFWLISVAHCIPVFILEYNDYTNKSIHHQLNQNVCYAEFNNQQMKSLMPFRLELFAVFCCIPLIICSFCYIRLIHILFRLPNINPKKRLRAIGLAIGTLLIFLTNNLVDVIGWYSPSWRVYTLLINNFYSCLDPFIFYFSSSALRETLEVLTQGLFKKLPCCPQPKHFNVEENVPVPVTCSSHH